MNELLRKKIKLEEGWRSKPYYCPAGKLSIGYGTNLESGISVRQGEALMDIKLEEITSYLSALLPVWNELNEARQMVLVEMAYNLGVNGLQKFQRMLAALNKHEFAKASAEILDSGAARQVPHRYARLAEIMATGVWR